MAAAACIPLFRRVRVFGGESGGWIARALSSEDYGWPAGAITSLLFPLIFPFPAAVWKAVDRASYHRDWTDLILFFEGVSFSLLFLLPFCILGTAFFIGGLHLWSYSHRSDG
jgi:hypothetical protein